MKKINMNFKTVFLGIIAVMLTVIVLFIGAGFMIAKNIIIQEPVYVKEVTTDENNIVTIIKD